MWLPFLALDSYVALEYGDAVPPLVNGYGSHGLIVDADRRVVEDVENQYCVRCYLEFKVAPVCNIGMHHGPLLNPNRPFAKPKNIDSLNGFGIYRLLDEDTSRVQVFLIPACADQFCRRKPGKSALLNHSFEVIEERRGIFREHPFEMILTYPGRMCLPRQCFDDVHNRSKYTQKKSVNQITGSSTGTAFEKISVWDDTLLNLCPTIGATTSDGRITAETTREIKATDILLITWLKYGGHMNNFHLQGSAIIYPDMIDHGNINDIALDFLSDLNNDENYQGMTLYNSQETLVGQKGLTLLYIGSGKYRLVGYKIIGIYNISGK